MVLSEFQVGSMKWLACGIQMGPTTPSEALVDFHVGIDVAVIAPGIQLASNGPGSAQMGYVS